MRSSKAISFLFLCLICFSSFILAVIVPPLESPDEIDHIKRAYLLSQGKIMLSSPPGMLSGGMIDSGLEQYLEFSNKYIRNIDVKITQEDIKSLNNMKWSGEKVFSPAPGTGYYFPAIYAPHAMALSFSKFLGLKINKSYYVTRFFVLSTIFIILAYSFYIYEPSVFMVAVLALPMNIFQESAASIDGISLAITVLAISIFMAAQKNRMDLNASSLFVFSFSVLAVVTCRTHMLPLLCMFFIMYYYNRKRPVLISGVAVSIFSVAWTLIAMKTTVQYNHTLHALSPAQRLVYYSTHPTSFFMMFYRTLTNTDILSGYQWEFIGSLGWLTMNFDWKVYLIISLSLVATFALCLNIKKNAGFERVSMISMALGAVFIVFLSLLLTCTDDGSKEILGVQGRYFTLPVIILSYATLGIERENKIRYVASISLLSFILIFSVSNTVRTIVRTCYTIN
ncbi:DUF2142 domain-containing protein [Komagataeibacter xylinus]|uniref:DUF2142 domain-containing protein n=1 Tax=Komagataeibacter xylinus TaxID=28448 RepID=A0A857FM44_KOMXY|nr:DUF2142 domain-containing protein [Komagataeibacter xylinus]QHC35291.1 DUF2142 domain-containing protein [Komagataeibacter xylinus]